MCSIGDLSLKDSTLLDSLASQSILGEVSKSHGDLHALYKMHKAHETQEMLAPYVDILEDELVAILKAEKDKLIAQLKNCTSSDIEVDLFSWNTVQWNESLSALQRRVAKMTPEERVEHSKKKKAQYKMIKEKGWETKFGILHDTWEADDISWAQEAYSYYSYPPKKVDFIFRHSDLAQRLVLALGPNFSTWTNSTRIATVGEYFEENSFFVLKNTLVLRYHPYGLKHQDLNKLLNVAKVQERRREKCDRHALQEYETAVGVDLLRITSTA